MNADYIIKGSTTYVADETGLHERPTTTNIGKVIRSENDVDTLNKILSEKESLLENATFKKKSYFKSILMWNIISFLLPVAFTGSIGLIDLLNGFIQHPSYLEGFKFFASICWGTGLFSNILNIPMYLCYQSEEKTLSKLVSYLQIKKEQATTALTEMRKQSRLTSDRNESKITSLKSYNETLETSLRRRAIIIERLSSLREDLKESKIESTIDTLKDEGFSTQEIAEAKSDMIKTLSIKKKNEV